MSSNKASTWTVERKTPVLHQHTIGHPGPHLWLWCLVGQNHNASHGEEEKSGSISVGYYVKMVSFAALTAASFSVICRCI